MTMMKKRYVITGMVEVGEYVRLILYPDEPVKEKKTFNLLDIARSGDPSQMQHAALIDAIVTNNPPTIYITNDECKTNEYKLGDHLMVTIEVE